MDTRTAKAAEAVDVEPIVREIRQFMPGVYKAIRDKAGEIGNEAFRLVRRGLRGEPGCFYAFERGRVVGTPFDGHGVQDDVAAFMVQFRCEYVCIWGPQAAGASHGQA